MSNDCGGCRCQNSPDFSYIEVNALAGFRPVYSTADSAGCDLRSRERVVIAPMQTVIVPTGVKITSSQCENKAIRPYLVLTIRSGLAAKGLILTNGIGVIDHGFRDEIKAIITNLSGKEFIIQVGDRIAQLIYAETMNVFGADHREDVRTGGLGSTGIN
jgi:dUTP pyrophosphatase